MFIYIYACLFSFEQQPCIDYITSLIYNMYSIFYAVVH